jgi:uncharacterized protein YigE (DUF2233 family)
VQDLKVLRATRNARRVVFEGQSFDIFFVNLLKHCVCLFWKRPNGTLYKNIDGLESWLKGREIDLVCGVNGGMFHPNMKPVGLYIERGCELFPLNLANGKGNFFLKPNGIFGLGATWATIVESSNYHLIKGSVTYATQSGPLLVIDDRIHPAFNEHSNNRRLRSGVGIIEDHRPVFVISNTPVSFFELALFFRNVLKCSNALYLDGTIVKMHLPELERKQGRGKLGVIIGIFERQETHGERGKNSSCQGTFWNCH